MKAVLRRLRGVLGTAVTWAVLWALIGGLFYLAWFLLSPPPARLGVSLWDALAIGVPVGAIAGAMTGAFFAVVLMIAERRNTIEQLSLGRMGVLGTAVGALLVFLDPLSSLIARGTFVIPRGLVPTMVVLGILGGSSAMVMLQVARRGIGPPHQRQLSGD